MAEMLAVIVPDKEMPFLLASLALALEVYQASGNAEAVHRLKKINSELFHQVEDVIEPPSRWMAWQGDRN